MDHLKDFFLLFAGQSNPATAGALKQATSSFIRVISRQDQRDCTLRLLAYVLDPAVTDVLFGDGVFDESWIQRLHFRVHHDNAHAMFSWTLQRGLSTT